MFVDQCAKCWLSVTQSALIKALFLECMNQVQYERVFAWNMQAAFLRPRKTGTWHMSHSPPINSLASERFEWDLEYLIFKIIFVTNG